MKEVAGAYATNAANDIQGSKDQPRRLKQQPRGNKWRRTTAKARLNPREEAKPRPGTREENKRRRQGQEEHPRLSKDAKRHQGHNIPTRTHQGQLQQPKHRFLRSLLCERQGSTGKRLPISGVAPSALNELGQKPAMS